MLRLLLCLFSLYWVVLGAQQPLQRAHAHNDYEKWRPAFRAALAQGFTSLEIDVFPQGKGSRLAVSHIPLFLSLKPDFERQYIRPLAAWIAERGGQVFPQAPGQSLILMVDVKRDGAEAYRRLRALAQRYEPLFTVYYPAQDSLRWGPLQLLISGSKPYAELQADSVWYMAIDGHWGELNNPNLNRKMVPRVSTSYRGQFKWRGRRGAMPEAELAKLRSYVAKAKAQGVELRFWGMPNNKAVWQVFLDEGVHRLNVDRIKRFRRFYENWESVQKWD